MLNSLTNREFQYLCLPGTSGPRMISVWIGRLEEPISGLSGPRMSSVCIGRVEKPVSGFSGPRKSWAQWSSVRGSRVAVSVAEPHSLTNGCWSDPLKFNFFSAFDWMCTGCRIRWRTDDCGSPKLTFSSEHGLCLHVSLPRFSSPRVLLQWFSGPRELLRMSLKYVGDSKWFFEKYRHQNHTFVDEGVKSSCEA